ncbi:phage holin family protein [Patescibacteria group bacterium]|nr:phage holin family protein [Patescibacteria group bacterium]
MKLILRLLFNAIILISAAYWLPGVVVDNFYSALITAIVLGLVNAIIRPVLILLTLPINILTLGLFTLVINGLLILFVASFIDGFSVSGLLPAILLSLVLWLCSWLTNALLIDEKR